MRCWVRSKCGCAQRLTASKDSSQAIGGGADDLAACSTPDGIKGFFTGRLMSAERQQIQCSTPDGIKGFFTVQHQQVDHGVAVLNA